MKLKDIFIAKLQQLPNDILQEVYYLDVIILKGRLQWNSFLAHKYNAKLSKDWLIFKINDWTLSMEKEDD